MREVIQSLNYLLVLGNAVAGFLLGWLWYSPLLFSRAWVREMGFTEAQLQAMRSRGMAGRLVQGFLLTLLGTFGLAVIMAIRGPVIWYRGAELGAFFGIFFVGARLANNGLWEQRSPRLLAITLGHEVVLFALQGGIFAWFS